MTTTPQLTEPPVTGVAVQIETPPELLTVIQSASLEPATAEGLLNSYRPLFVKANQILAKSKGVAESVTDATRVTEMKNAKIIRLQLKEVRVEAEKMKDVLKADSLRRSNAIQGVFNVLKYMVEPVEEQLMEAEKFAERAEAARKAALKAEREIALQPFGVDTTFYDLANMPEPTFDQLFFGAKAAHEAKIEAARKAEADRIAKEAAEAAERQRVKDENARLKREADERETAAKIERERVATEKAEAERVVRELAAENERKLAEERRIAAEKLAAELAEQKRIADEAAAAAAEIARKEREALEAKAEQARKEAAETARQERLRQQAIAEVERQKAATEKAKLEAKIKADREFAEKLRAEAAEIARKELVARQVLEAAERAKQEAANKAVREEAERQRVAREKLEAEKEAFAEASRKAEMDRIAAEKKAAQAPDKEKILAYADQLAAVNLGTIYTLEAQKTAKHFAAQLAAGLTYLRTEANKL